MGFKVCKKIQSFTLTVGSVESSRTCTMTLSDGHDIPHAAPMESLYTCVPKKRKGMVVFYMYI